MGTRNTSWEPTSLNTWTHLKKKTKKNLRNTSLNTSRLALTQKTWKKCTPSVMPPSVQSQNLLRSKTQPRRTSQSFIPSCPSRRGGISVRTCFVISLYGHSILLYNGDIKNVERKK